MITGCSLYALSAPALAALSTGTIIRIRDDRYTVDAGRADGLSLNQELTVLKNGEEVGRLKVVSLRENEADATALTLPEGVTIRVGDTVTYEPGAAVEPPAPEPPMPEPPTPEPPSPEPPAPDPMTPTPPSPEPPTPETPTPDPATPGTTPPPTKPLVIDLRPGGRQELLPPTEAQQQLVQALVDEGFENVMAAPTANGGVYVEFENRRYRWEIEGLGAVMRTVARLHAGGDLMTVIGKIRGVPLYQVQVGVEDFRAYLAGTLTDAEFRERLIVDWPDTQGHRGANRSFGRVDATLGYGLRLNLISTFFTPPPDPQLLLRLGLETDLFKGFRARFREWIPLNKDRTYRNNPHVATAEATYLRKLGRRLYGQLAVGQFQEDLSAVRGEGTYFISPDLLFHGQVSRVRINPTDRDTTSYLGTFRRRIPNTDAEVFTTFGKYLYGDRGRTIGLTTQFREREYEFAYTDTNLDKNVSFTVRWPLGGPRYPEPKALRFRRERQFRFTYFSDNSSVGARPPTEGFAEDWQLANMPGTLPTYVAFLRGREAAGDSPLLMERVRDVPLSAQLGPATSGSTGLWFVPAAEVVPYGYWVLGAHWVPPRYRPHANQNLGGNGSMAQYFTLGALPNLEITLRITNLSGRLGAQKYFHPSFGASARGYNIDRMVSAQYLLMRETDTRPGLLVGGQDFLGEFADLSVSVIYKAYYGMLSKRIGGVRVHAGFGTDLLKGLLVGADKQINDRMRLIIDHQRGNTTAGVRFEALKNVRLDLYAPGLKTFGAGLTYTRRM